MVRRTLKLLEQDLQDGKILLGTTMAVCTAPRGGNIWLCVYQAVLTSPLHASTHQLGLTATSACVWSSSHAWRRFCSEILCLVRARGLKTWSTVKAELYQCQILSVFFGQHLSHLRFRKNPSTVPSGIVCPTV